MADFPDPEEFLQDPDAFMDRVLPPAAFTEFIDNVERQARNQIARGVRRLQPVVQALALNREQELGMVVIGLRGVPDTPNDRMRLFNELGRMTIEKFEVLPLAFSLTAESWVVTADADDPAACAAALTTNPSKHPNRKEAITISGSTIHGRDFRAAFAITRNHDGKLVMGAELMRQLPTAPNEGEKRINNFALAFFHGVHQGIGNLVVHDAIHTIGGAFEQFGELLPPHAESPEENEDDTNGSDDENDIFHLTG